MKVNRVEQHQINKNHPIYNLIDNRCYHAKNLYNYANYIIRQEFINNSKYINSIQMCKDIKYHEPFLELKSQSAQCVLRLLDKNWKSYFKAIKSYKKNPEKFLGKPRLPKYKDKNGRSIFLMCNLQAKIVDNELIFRNKLLREFKFKTKIDGRLISIRFIPTGSIYVMEIVYEIDVPRIDNTINRCVGIDLGLNNLITVANNTGLEPFIIKGKIIKSINHRFNKIKARLQSELIKRNNMYKSNQLESISRNRFNKIKDYMHKTSKKLIDYCVLYNIDTIIVGYNKNWKQEINIGKKNNQNFVSIPYYMLANQIEYKAENNGIKLIKTEESFTSGCSFIDNEPLTREFYNKKRRIKRGLFKSNEGKLINADLNGAYNIIKKVVPNVFTDGIKGVCLHPVIM